MKKLLSVILCLALVLCALPSLALAAGAGVSVSNMDELSAAIAAASPGDTITLASGTYAPAGGVLTIDKAVNLTSSGETYAEFNGAIVYDLANDSRGYRVEVSRIKFSAVNNQQCALALTSGRGWVLAVENCSFDGWMYGAAIYPDCRSCKLDVYDSDFDTFCAVSVAAVNGNGIQRLMPGASGLYEYNKYDNSGHSAYYYDYDATGKLDTGYALADYAPAGQITAERPYQARIGDHFYASLDAALKAAKSGDTVYALRGVEYDTPVTVTVKSGVTLDVDANAYLFESVVNNGALINRGVIRGGVTSEGETRVLARAMPKPKSLTVTVTDTSGRVYEPESGTLDYLLPEGNYTFTFSGDGYYTSAQTVTIAAARAQIVTADVSQRLSFSDVSSADWFYEDVFNVYSSGLMGGVSDTSFAPNQPVTRAMAATIIYRLAGEPDMPEANWGYPYADVDANSWYATAVYWARLNKIVNGTSDDAFSPNAPVTREQLAAMLYRYAAFAGMDTSDKGGYRSFADAKSVSAWAVSAASWASERGIITGTDGNRFDPQGSATRVQLAAMLVRFQALKG